MTRCDRCGMPIFKRWHGFILTNEGIAHDYCFFDMFMTELQVNLRRERVSIP